MSLRDCSVIAGPFLSILGGEGYRPLPALSISATRA
jgi:hypothetical protein